jgi:hypothetical protein
MERLPLRPRLVTDGMSGGGTIIERFSMTAPGSQGIDVPSTIMPLSADVNVAAADHPVVFGPDHRPSDGHPNGGPGEQPGLGHGWDEMTQTGNGGWKQL